jgi:hypothetical protein
LLFENRLKVNIMSRLMFRRPVCVGVKPHLGPKTIFLLLSDSCGIVDVGRHLSRENGSVVYNCYWPSPAQSFSGPSRTGLMTIFISLSQFRDSRNLEGQVPIFLLFFMNGWRSYTPRNCVSFSSLPTTRRATVEVFEPASIPDRPNFL